MDELEKIDMMIETVEELIEKTEKLNRKRSLKDDLIQLYIDRVNYIHKEKINE